jgi:hypothetical protein
LTGLVWLWRIFFGCRRPEVGSILPLVVFDQIKSSLARKDRPLAPASGRGRWQAGDSNITSLPMLPARGSHSTLTQWLTQGPRCFWPLLLLLGRVQTLKRFAFRVPSLPNPCHVSRFTLDDAESNIGRPKCCGLYWLNQRVIEYGAFALAPASLIHGNFLSWLYCFLLCLDKSKRDAQYSTQLGNLGHDLYPLPIFNPRFLSVIFSLWGKSTRTPTTRGVNTRQRVPSQSSQSWMLPLPTSASAVSLHADGGVGVGDGPRAGSVCC